MTGCSWIQRMHKLTGGNKRTGEWNGVGIDYNSFGGQGVWRIEHYLESNDFSHYDFVVVQLPTPIRNEVHERDTTSRFKAFLEDIKKEGEEEASKNLLDSYKQKMIDISNLHKRVVFFLYNVGGYPLRHPYDFGVNAEEDMIEFFNETGLEYIRLSFEGSKGYGLDEKECEDEELWDFYHKDNPPKRSKEFKKYWSLISPKGVISTDPHPNEKANKIALELIINALKGN